MFYKMKRLYVAILIISFHLSSIETAKNGSGEPPATPSDPQTEQEENKETILTDDELIARLADQTKSGISRTFSPYTRNSHEEIGSSLPAGASAPKHESEEELRGVYRRKKQKKQNIRRLASTKKTYWPKELPHTGSMTPYRFLLETIPKDLKYFQEPEKRSEKSRYKDCTPVRVWTLSRHGTRYPSKETVHGMRTRLLNLQESMLLKLYENGKFDKKDDFDMDTFLKLLEKWEVVEELKEGVVYVSNDILNKEKPKKDATKEKEALNHEERRTLEKKRKGAEEKIEGAKNLTAEGIDEMYALGKRFSQRFKTIMEEANPESLLFKFTDCQRTRASATEFYKATGLYGNSEDPEWKPPPNWHAPVETGNEGKDPLLKYDAVCGHWKRNYKKSDLNAHQLEYFVNGKEIRESIEGITEILQTSMKSITFSDGKMFYETCAFEMAWGLKSPWCMVLTEKYQAVFEYLEDFEFFKNDGPDNWVNKKLGCFLFKDMVARLIGHVRKDEDGKMLWNIEEETEEPGPTGENSPETEPKKESLVKKATFYFTHLTAILKFITHFPLDIEDEDTLRADNYDEMGDRKWRTARIGVFATNITVTLMKCDDAYFILVLHQERPVVLPKCEEELCPLDVFLKAYEESIFECNYDEICEKYKNPIFNQSFTTVQSRRFTALPSRL